MPDTLANGIRIEYDEIGDSTDPAMLLVMGFGAQLINWPDDFCEALAGHGFRVIRYDNRDVGLSERFEGMGEPNAADVAKAVADGAPVDIPYRLGDMAADGIGLLDALDVDRAHVVGASMGGMIVQLMAVEHGARLRSMTSIMSGTGNPALPQAKPEALEALLSRPADPNDRDSVIEHTLKVHRVIASPQYPTPDDLARHRAAATYDRAYYPAGRTRQYAAILADGSRVERLSRVTVPSLVIHGSDDPLVRVESGKDTANAIPGAKLMVIEGMAHDLPPGLVKTLADAIATHAKGVDRRVAAE